MSCGSIRASLSVACLAATLVAALPSAASAQSLWMARDSDRAVMLEMLRPSIEGTDQDLFSAAYFLSCRTQLFPGYTFVGELPFARFEDAAIGNLYSGLEVKIGSGPVFLELGSRWSFASDQELESLVIGILSDVTRRAAFVPRILTFEAAFDVYEVTPARMSYRLRVGPSFVGPAPGSSGANDIYVHYSLQVGYQGAGARLGAGMAGRALMSDNRGTVGQRTLNQVELHADFLPGHFRPGLDLRLPLGSLSQTVPVVLGGSITLAL